MFNESGDVAVLGVMEHGRCEVAVVANRGERKRVAHPFDPAAGLLAESAEVRSRRVVSDTTILSDRLCVT